MRTCPHVPPVNITPPLKWQVNSRGAALGLATRVTPTDHHPSTGPVLWAKQSPRWGPELMVLLGVFSYQPDRSWPTVLKITLSDNSGKESFSYLKPRKWYSASHPRPLACPQMLGWRRRDQQQMGSFRRRSSPDVAEFAQSRARGTPRPPPGLLLLSNQDRPLASGVTPIPLQWPPTQMGPHQTLFGVSALGDK